MTILALLNISFDQFLGKGLYIGMLLLLFIASIGVPIPEDIPLLLGGAIARVQDKELIYVILVGLIGVLSGDIILYTAGRKFGLGVLKIKPFKLLFTSTHVAQMKIQFRKRGNWIIFFGRFFAGVRSVMCVTAGMCKVPAWKFVLLDLSGALCTVPLLVIVGWWFSKNINRVIQGVGVVEKIIGAVVAMAVIGWVLYIHVSKRSKIHQVEKDAKQVLESDASVSELDAIEEKGEANELEDDTTV
jgi:membrane protein DedA with SNARE-associated domain